MKPQYIEIDEYGNKYYYSNKKMTILHREDGPAMELYNSFDIDGEKVSLDWGDYWFFNGKRVTEAEHAQLTRKMTISYKEEPTININGKEFNAELLNALINNGPLNKEIFNDRAGIEVW